LELSLPICKPTDEPSNPFPFAAIFTTTVAGSKRDARRGGRPAHVLRRTRFAQQRETQPEDSSPDARTHVGLHFGAARQLRRSTQACGNNSVARATQKATINGTVIVTFLQHCKAAVTR